MIRSAERAALSVALERACRQRLTKICWNLSGFTALGGPRAIQFAGVTTREMEQAVGNEPSQTAQSSGAAETKDFLCLNRLDDLLQQLGDTMVGPLREAEGSIASHPLSSIGADSYWALRSVGL